MTLIEMFIFHFIMHLVVSIGGGSLKSCEVTENLFFSNCDRK